LNLSFSHTIFFLVFVIIFSIPSFSAEINNLDYRAWYGLGQTYEILRLPYYGLYYYKQAHMVRPNDPRMLTALGEAFEKQEKISEAMKCYNKSRAIGDADGKALFKLAK
jgi:hypothetical protein